MTFPHYLPEIRHTPALPRGRDNLDHRGYNKNHPFYGHRYYPLRVSVDGTDIDHTVKAPWQVKGNAMEIAVLRWGRPSYVYAFNSDAIVCAARRHGAVRWRLTIEDRDSIRREVWGCAYITWAFLPWTHRPWDGFEPTLRLPARHTDPLSSRP